jgi:hypothetical protein
MNCRLILAAQRRWPIAPLALIIACTLPHTAHAQVEMADTPESNANVLAYAVSGNIITEASLPFYVGLLGQIRTEQQLVYQELFGQQVLVGSLSDTADSFMGVLDPNTSHDYGFATATTDDGRTYSIQTPYVFQAPFDWQFPVPAGVAALRAAHPSFKASVCICILQATVGESTHEVCVLAASVQCDGVANGSPQFIIIRRLNAACLQLTAQKLMQLGLYHSQPCLDGNGNPAPADQLYQDCVDAAQNKYKQKDDANGNTALGWGIGGGIGWGVVGVAGCILFPEVCLAAAATVLIADGASTLGILYNFENTDAAINADLEADLAACCRDLRQRKNLP